MRKKVINGSTNSWIDSVHWKIFLRGLIYFPLFVLVYFAAYWLRFDGDVRAVYTVAWQFQAVYVVIAKFSCFGFWGLYRSTNRHLSFHDLIVLIKATTASSVILVIGDHLLTTTSAIPRSVLLIDWGGTIIAIGALRTLFRLKEEPTLIFSRFSAGNPVLIAGAGDNGESLLRMLRRVKRSTYTVVGFTAKDASMVGATIGGVPIVGTIEDTCQFAHRHGIREILVTGDGLNGKQLRGMIDEGSRVNIGVKVLPSYERLIEGKVDLAPRRVSIEDLLRRDPVHIDQGELHQWLHRGTLMVTGSAGSIGSEICRQLLSFDPRQLILVDRWENGQFYLNQELASLGKSCDIEVCMADIFDRNRIDRLMQRYRPDIIFHTAAYKHVPLMEANPGEAVKNIVLLTSQLADLAHVHKVKSFVMVSTDKAVNPTNVMGACKRVAETYVQSMSERSDCRFVTVRFGNVLGSAGSVVPIFRSQIARGGPITVTHPDMVRYFMTIPEASQLVIQAGAMGRGGEIFVLDMGNPIKIIELARDMIRLSGLKENEDIEIEVTGTRAGEKMFEELHLANERHLATTHPKIKVAECIASNSFEILQAINRLRNSVDLSDELVIAELNRIVPEFQRAVPRPRRQMAA